MTNAPSLLVELGRRFSTLVPLLSTIFFAIIMLIPIGSSSEGVLMPHFVLIAVFYWLSHRPLLMPYGLCMFAGLLLDLWIGAPLGLNILMLLFARVFVLNQLKYFRGRSRLVYWAVFSLMAGVFFFASWVLVSLVHGQIEAPLPVVFQWLVTSFFYGPVALLLARMRRAMV